MLESIKLAIAMSENRTKLGELSSLAEPTDEQRADLEKRTTDHTGLETKYRDALRTETKGLDEKRADDTGFVSLQAKALAESDWVRSALEGRDPTGASAEYSKELFDGQVRSATGSVLVPWLDFGGWSKPEERAAGTTDVMGVQPGPG